MDIATKIAVLLGTTVGMFLRAFVFTAGGIAAAKVFGIV